YGYVPNAGSEEIRSRVPFPASVHFARRGQWLDIYINPAAADLGPLGRSVVENRGPDASGARGRGSWLDARPGKELEQQDHLMIPVLGGAAGLLESRDLVHQLPARSEEALIRFQNERSHEFREKLQLVTGKTQ